MTIPELRLHVSHLNRHGRSAGALLSAYMVRMIAAGLITDPGRIVEIGTARIAGVLLLFRPSPALTYTLRVLVAIIMAVYTAYYLELETPYSAGTTVLVVMNTSRGAILSKSLWRIAGSIIGATAAVVLIALFAQTPVLFVFGLAAWIGLCTFVGSLLRYNRGYAAVLAGYTVVLVAFGAIANPEHIFQLAMGRVAVVSIGVIATALVFLLTDFGPGRRQLEQRIVGLIVGAADLIQAALRSGDFSKAIGKRRRLAADLTVLDQVLEFAATEDANLGRYKSDLRFAVAELFAILTGGLHTVTLMRRTQRKNAFAKNGVRKLDDALSLLATLSPDRSTGQMRQTLKTIANVIQDLANDCRHVPTLAALDQATALLAQFDMTLESLQALQEGHPRISAIQLKNYFNPVTALRNGLRAGLAMSMAGIFWIVSQWPDGGSMLGMIGPVCALVSQSDNAAKGSVDFLKGTVLAVIAAFICTYGILPSVTGFPLLMAAMLPFIAAGVFVSQNPRFAGISLGYLVFFITLVGANNPMHYDLVASLNTYLAFIVGGVCAVLAFRVLLPPNPLAEARVLAHSIRNDVQRLIRSRHMPHLMVWEHLQHQKAVRLSRRLTDFPAHQEDAIIDSIAAIIVGRHLAALKLAAQDLALPDMARGSAGRTIEGFQHLLSSPEHAAEIAHTESIALTASHPPQAVMHLAATLHDLSSLVCADRGFFARGAIIPDYAA